MVTCIISQCDITTMMKYSFIISLLSPQYTLIISQISMIYAFSKSHTAFLLGVSITRHLHFEPDKMKTNALMILSFLLQYDLRFNSYSASHDN